MLPQACRAPAVRRNLEAMEVHFAPELQAKLDQLVRETGRPVEELIEDAFAGYAPELAQTREMLDSRYDDLKSGQVKPTAKRSLRAFANEKMKSSRGNNRGAGF